MKIQRSKSSTHLRLLWVFSGLLITILSVSAAIYISDGNLFGWRPFGAKVSSSLGNNPPSAEQVSNGTTVKKSSTQDGKTSGSDQPQKPESQPDGRQLVGLDIVSVRPIASSPAVIRVSVLIAVLDQTGTCTLTITDSSGSTLYSASAGVQASANSSTCQGFDFPASKVQQVSKYKINVAYTSSLKYGSADYESN